MIKGNKKFAELAKRLGVSDETINARNRAAGLTSLPGEAPAAVAIGLFIVQTPRPGVAQVHEFAEPLRNRVVELLRRVPWQSSLKELHWTPRLSDPRIAPIDDSIRHSKGGSVTVSVGLDYAGWGAASREQQLQAIVDNLRRSIDMIKPGYLASSDRSALHDALASAANDCAASLTKLK